MEGVGGSGSAAHRGTHTRFLAGTRPRRKPQAHPLRRTRNKLDLTERPDRPTVRQWRATRATSLVEASDAAALQAVRGATPNTFRKQQQKDDNRKLFKAAGLFFRMNAKTKQNKRLRTCWVGVRVIKLELN